MAERDPNRKFRPHRKSRQGCGNCKLRKVKCDESKPRCRRCITYGVLCNYDGKYPDLQLSVDGALNLEVLQEAPTSLYLVTPSMTAPVLTQNLTEPLEIDAVYQLRGQDLELLSKFQTRTVFTISTDKSLIVYQNEMIKLACSHPFLMHALLSLTLMHDSFLSAPLNKRLSSAEAFHWYRSSALLNDKLSGVIQHSERDAIWATAVVLGTISFCHIEAKTPEEAWPLRPPSSSDLTWLRMSEGKREIWKIAQPLRRDSIFQALALQQMNFLPAPSKEFELEALPFKFIKLCDLDATSTANNNPYYAAASNLAQSLNVDNVYSVIINFLYFISHMEPDYKQLLERKDPRALLLLAYWYTKVCECQIWWISRRAVLECQAICIYLERHHRQEIDIYNLMQYPRTVFGIATY